MRVVIVGAGLAGHRAATHLRELSADVEIDLIGDENDLPYDRPPLSKEVLAGGAPKFLACRDDYGKSAIGYHAGERVARIDRAASRVNTESGKSYSYDRLLLATGSRPRRLPDRIAQTSKIIYLRTLRDAVQLQSAIKAARRIAIIGGGFIGLEVAAAARAAGTEVVVLETANRLLSRGMPAILADWIYAQHDARGVSIHFNTTVHAITDRSDGRLQLDWSGGSIDVDSVVVGIGIEPNVELALEAGLIVDNGIVVDERCQTSDPSVFAAGEVTSHPVLGGIRRRLESWRVASDQPLIAAKSMLGLEARYVDPPWLWSDQFAHNIQSLGIPVEQGNTLIAGDVTSDRWTAIFCDTTARITGAVAVNSGRDISVLRRAMMKDCRIPEPLLARIAGAPQTIR